MRKVSVKGWIAVVLAVAVPTIPSSAEQYLCIGEHSTGFTYDKSTKEWRSTKFQPEKYIVKPSKFYEYEVSQHPSVSVLTIYCKEGFDENGYLLCTDAFRGFRMNKVNGRFLLIFRHGYYNVLPGKTKTDEEGDTPYMAIGHWSEI